MAWGAIAASIAAPTLASFLGGGGKSTNVSQVPMETPEQREARKKLLDFGNTGKHLDYKVGEAYGGSFGNFDLSNIEKAGQFKLSGLINSGMPGVFNTGTAELEKFLGTDTYDPYNEKGIFSNFKKSFEREMGDSSARLKHNLAFNKNLSGSDTIKQFSDLEARGQETMGNKLAELFDTYSQRRLSAIPMALQAGQAEEGINMGRVGASMQFGGLERTLQNMLADKQYQDFLRQRTEMKEPLSAMGQVAGSNTPFGVPNVSVPQSSPWDSLLNTIAGAGGYALGTRLAK